MKKLSLHHAMMAAAVIWAVFTFGFIPSDGQPKVQAGFNEICMPSGTCPQQRYNGNVLCKAASASNTSYYLCEQSGIYCSRGGAPCCPGVDPSMNECKMWPDACGCVTSQ